MKAAYLLIGGNLGQRLAFLHAAEAKIQQKGIVVTRKSSVYETEAWGKTDQPAFLNQVLCVKTSFSAAELLVELLDIEKSLGRVRGEKNGARTIDIDILYFENELINIPGLTIPHERIALRRFVLIPLAELIPDFLDPTSGKTIKKMLLDCRDTLSVTLFKQIKK